MLIPNKFNGYSSDNIRLYHAGGGIGEAALIGAALGGGASAITGGDPLKGALLGGLTGGAGAGIGGALAGGATPVAETLATAGAGAGTAAGTVAGTEAALASALPASSLAATPVAAGLPAAGQSFTQASQLANTAAGTQGLNAAMGQALPLTGSMTGGIGGGVGGGGIAGLPAVAPAAVVPTAAAPAAAQTSFQQAMTSPGAYIKANPFAMGAAGLAGAIGGKRDAYEEPEYNGPLKKFRYDPATYRPSVPYAEGGIASLADGGNLTVGGDPRNNPPPISQDYNSSYDWQSRSNPTQMMAGGGIADLGSYSDGGRMLRGPGDGMSDSIPANIGGKRPARLAEGEFVVPADVVSHLGNGSTDAGAKQLYAMMNKVRQARTGRQAQGREIKPRKYLPV